MPAIMSVPVDWLTCASGCGAVASFSFIFPQPSHFCIDNVKHGQPACVTCLSLCMYSHIHSMSALTVLVCEHGVTCLHVLDMFDMKSHRPNLYWCPWAMYTV